MLSLKFCHATEVKAWPIVNPCCSTARRTPETVRAPCWEICQVRRVDAKGGQLLLLLHSPITEREYLTLLEKSGVSGFSLCR